MDGFSCETVHIMSRITDCKTDASACGFATTEKSGKYKKSLVMDYSLSPNSNLFISSLLTGSLHCNLPFVMDDIEGKDL